MKKLTVEQLIVLERLGGKQYTLSGTLRKKSRREWDDDRLGIPRSHRIWWINQQLVELDNRFAQTPTLKNLFRNILLRRQRDLQKS